MTALPKTTIDNVIELRVVDGKIEKKPKIRYNKDGSIDKRKSNAVAGRSCEVYAFTSKEEIKAMIDVFNRHIGEAKNENQRQIASRNKMLFLIGINASLRASDLISLKWNFFLNEDGTFKKLNSLQPKKTRKTGKYVKVFFNEAVKKAITEYLNKYPVENMDEYLFKSRKGDGHITEISLGRIIKDTAAEVGIDRNICSHSLRKSFGFWVYHNAEDKNDALITLQKIYNHSSPAMTSKYIGLTDDEMSSVFNKLNLGIDFI